MAEGNLSEDPKVCVVCGEPATHECNYHMGNWGCHAPLCAIHQDDDHHPDDKAWKEYAACGNVKNQLSKGASIDHLWYAFMAGYRAGRTSK